MAQPTSAALRKAIELAATEMSVAEIAQVVGLTKSAVYTGLHRHGVVRASTVKAAAAFNDRAERMASMFRQGCTLQKIGDQFGLTRERVRQVLKSQGLTRDDGGQAFPREMKLAAKAAAIEARFMKKYGLPSTVVKQLQRDRITHAFNAQQRTARLRGIAWKLTFAEWFAIWKASGKLHLRGRTKNSYVMSRIRDDGGYELGNVHIQTAQENSREAVQKWKGRVKENRGVFCLYPGREMAWFAKCGKHKIGFFRTEAEAAEARTRYMLQHGLRDAARGRGYTVINRGGKLSYQAQAGRRYLGTFKTSEEAVAARDAYLSEMANPVPPRALPNLSPP